MIISEKTEKGRPLPRINELDLKFGSSPTSESNPIALKPITIFVGPNNSGKSLVLNEIGSYCAGEHNKVPTNSIVKRLGIVPLSQDEIDGAVEQYTVRNANSRNLPPNNIYYGSPDRHIQVDRNHLVQALSTGDPSFCSYYLRFATLTLGGADRIALINKQAMGDLKNSRPHLSFQVLFRDKVRRHSVREVLQDAFGQFLVIDPSNSGSLGLVFSNRQPISDVEEQGLNEASLEYYANATPIETMSDGVKAFTGIITEIVAGDPQVLIVDEPEAFLHPPLAFKLGREMARLTSKTDKSLFVSTHSSDFVMGCIQSGVPVTIVRLTYRAGTATARVLNSEDVFKFMRNPLLRSTGVLNSLFYEYVVVTESDTDRAFYQEVNERLLRTTPPRGIPNCLFLNAQNKQTVKTIIRPLRELGIPAAAIVDVDIVKEGGVVWSSFLDDAGFVPDVDRQSLATSRKAIYDRLIATNKDMKSDGGIDLLAPSDREAANNMFDLLEKYGLFVVRKGELESWLSALGATGKKTTWLINIFGKMGEDSESATYVRPGSGDVWEFISTLKRWFLNADRSGIPS